MQLELVADPLSGKAVEIHAGAAYVNAIEPILRARGGRGPRPAGGLSIGRRLSWYLQNDRGATPASILERLHNDASAMTLADVLATGGDGLYIPGDVQLVGRRCWG